MRLDIDVISNFKGFFYRRMRFVIATVVISAGTGFVQTNLLAQQQGSYYVKIVGIGAQNCNVFIKDINLNAQMIRDYVAWAQGFMSGALMRAPEGKDVGLDLLPERLNLEAQVEFLKKYCRDHEDRAFSDAVIDLYRVLQAPPS